MDRWRWRCTCVVLGCTVISGGCATVPPCPPPETIVAPAPQAMPSPALSVAPSTAALEHKVKAQEKRIAELSMQLRMLKRIDLDGKKER
ncbi:MAG: hypothetical protein K0S45_4418 [Nitrospira sp.]|nr:hypothetical protein [Nitrospira sp.]